MDITRVVRNVDEACEILEQETEIGFDTETSGLSPWRDHLALMQFCGRNSKTPVVLRIPDGVVPKRVLKLFETGNRTFVGHNLVSFDNLFLGTHGVDWQKSKYFDTLVGEGLISTTGRRDVSRNLKNSVRRRLGMTLDKDIEHGNWGAEQLSDKQLEYAAGDVIHLIDLMDEQKSKAEQQGQTEAMEMEMELVPIVSEMTLNGLPLPIASLHKWLDEQRELQKESKAWITKNMGEFNMNSWQQKIKAAAAMGVTLENTQSDYLADLAENGSGITAEVAKNLHDYSAPAQRLKMYSEAWQNMHIVDEWAHPRFWQVGTDTLRFSSSDPNFQQLPKDGRKIIGNIPGLKIVNADYSQIEVRIAAEIAHDYKLIELLQEGDVHANIAALVFGIPKEQVSEAQRRSAKAATFTLLFGGSADRLYKGAKSYGASMTEDEAYEVFTKFFQTFDGLRRIREQAFGMKGRRVVTIRFPNSSKRVIVGRNVTPTRILNTAVQGPAAVGMKYALLEAKKNGIMQFIGSTVHDELVAAVPDKYVEEVSHLLNKSMVDGMHRAFPDMTVKVEVKSGDYWQK